jgi:hypothetical protein
MSKKIGIDLLKGIAAYSVVWIHSSYGGLSTDDNWVIRTGLFFNGFAVPFFLATSFYLITQKVFFSENPYHFRSRFKFLVIPYITWTFIYSIFRLGKYYITGNTEKFNDFLVDPVSIILLGGAGVQLYYIPLLISGIITMFFMAKIIPKSKLRISLIILLLSASTLIYQLIIFSGNDFRIGANVAFQSLLNSIAPNLTTNQLIRIILVSLSWILRCVPYIFTAILLNHPLVKKKFCRFNIISTLIFLVTAITFNTIQYSSGPIFPKFIDELIVAYCFFIVCDFIVKSGVRK